MQITQKNRYTGWLLQGALPLIGGGDITKPRSPLRTGDNITEPRSEPTPVNNRTKPPLSHQQLVEEINECLELLGLDHPTEIIIRRRS